MTDKKSLDFKRYFRNRIRRIEAFIMLILFSFNIFAEIVPDPASIGARATKTASGIDQLDITAPNKNGTSYNSLKELQVSEQGLILNNNKDIVVNTKTAGYVTRNRNLDNSIAASLIITEVTGKNKTNINGTVEVAGKRADLVMANRNGIYVNGGNFLNTDRVTLTTGSLEMKNGDLVAINVTQGQIGIGGKGIDALNLTDLELLGKTIDVSGVIKASKETRLLVSAGGQTYEYKTKEVKSKGESYKGIAIDGKAVGSMYAGKIDIISNDKGAGVNTKGDLVSVDDIVLTANGDITTAKVDSGKDLKYETTQKVKMNGKTTIAKKVKVKAKETEINAKVITGYLEKALGKKSLSIESEKTKITSKIEAYGKVEIKSDYTQNNGEISANEKINIVGNKLNNNNGEIRSQEKIAINTKETSNVKGYILSDGLTKEDVKKEENKKAKNTKENKNSEKGIEITGNLDNTEGVIRGREISLGNLTGNNKGKIDSIGALTFNGKTIVNKGGLISGNIQELNVDKLINDEGKLLSTEKISGKVKKISNKNGEISGTEAVKLIGEKLNNLSGLIKSNGKIVLDTKETSNIKGYILSDGLTKEDVKKEENKKAKNTKENKNSEKGIEITGNLDNTEGVIRGREVSLGNLTGNNKGKIDSIGALTFNGKTIVNKGGLISGNIQELNVDKLINDEGKLLSTEKINGTAKEISNKNGEITGTQTVKLVGDKLNNLSGLIKSNGKITLDMKETSNVKGYILSDGLTKEDVKKEENKNQKDVKEDKNKEKGINITGDLDNREGVIRGKEVTVGGNLTGNNKGKIDSIGALTFNGKTIVNKGGIITGNIQELNVDKLINDEGKLLSTEKISGTAKETSNKNGEISGTQTVKLIGDKLNNLSGLIKSNGKIALGMEETSNVKGYILSDGLTKEDVKKEENKNQKGTENTKNKEKGIEITGDLDNTEGVIRGREISLGNLTGNNKGKIDSIGALTFNGKTIVNKGGLISGNIQELNVDKLINDEGKLLSTEKINGTAKEISNVNGEITGTQTVKLIGDRLNNLSGVVRSYGKVKLNEKDVSNVEGYILSDGITKEQAQNWKVEEKAIEESKDDKNQKDVNEKKEQTTGTLLNLGRLDNTKGIIASLSQTTVNIGKIANNDGKIVSKGAVELTTPNEYEYKGLVEGDYSTKLNAKKIIINDNIDRKNTLSLISKEELTLGQNIRARILSIATQADLRNTKDISATNLLSITAKSIENSGNLYSNGNTYLEAKNGDLINKDGGSIKADKQVYIKVENGRVVNGTAKYLDGAYRREDGVLVDNRQTSKEKPSIIAGKTETIIKAKDFINTSLIGKAGQGITYIELAGQGINASIGDNTAKIEGQKVSVEGNKGVTNIGAVISGTEITRVTSKNGKVLNESTITTEKLTRTVEKKKKFLRKKYTEVYGTIENIRNIGKIEGNGIVYVEGKEIENVAGNIGGAGGTLLKSTLGNIEDKTITLIDNRRDVTETYTEMREVKPKGKWWRIRDDKKPVSKKYEQVQLHRYWDIVNKTKTVSGVIGNGKDTILDSAKDLILESSDIRAKDNIALNAKNNLLMLSTVGTEYKFRTETSSKRSWGRKKTKTETWIEDNVYVNPVELTSGGYILINYREKGKPDNKGVFAQGVNFNAKKGIIAKSDGNIYIQGVKDNLNSTYDSHTTKSFIGIKYKRTSDYVSDNREKYKHSQLYGEAGVTLDSQGRLRVQGIDIQTIGPVYLKGVKGVEILSGNEVSSKYEAHTSKGLKIGVDKKSLLKGLEYNINRKATDNLKINSIGSIINSKGGAVTIEGDKVVSIGSKIGAAGDINLIGKNGVIIKDGENFAKIKEENEKARVGMFTSWSLKNLSAGIGIEGRYDKTDDGKTVVTPEKNVIVTNKNLNITSTSGNIFIQGDFGAKEDINVKAEKGKIFIKDSKSEVLTDSKSINARVALTLGTSLSGIKDTLKSSFNVVKNSKELLKMPKIAKKLLKGKDLNEALAGNEGAIEEANLIANGPKSGNAETGLYLSGSLTNTKQNTKIINSIGSNLIAKNNITLKSGDDINLTMVNIISKNIFINAGKNINIYAGKSTVESRESTKSLSGSYNLLTDQFSIGANATKDKLEAESYSNSKIIGENINIKGKDLTIKGANIIGNTVNINVANLHLESLQDKLKSTHKGFNTSGGNLSLGMGKEYSAGLGMEYGNHDKAWVSEQSSIVGRNSANINVKGKTNLIGSVIGGVNTILRTGKLEYSDIYDKDKGYDIGLNTNASFRLKRKWDKDTQTTSERIIVTKSGGLNYGATDREQINRATIGNGTIIVGGKIVNPDINRDESKAQEITKNINVNKISLQYSDNTKKWSMDSVEETLGEQFKNLTVAPMYGLINKLKLDEKYKVFESVNTPYLMKVTKNSEDDVPTPVEERIDFSKPLDKSIDAYVTGMATNYEYAKTELLKHNIKKFYNDNNLEGMKVGETRKYLLFHNETRGFIGDVIECGFDKFGVKGNNHIYSKAAQQLGEMLFRNKGNFPTVTLFSQGNIQYYAALNYLEDKYGEGVLEDIIGTKKYNSYGSPLKRDDFINFLQSRRIKATVNSKNDKMDGVANIVGGNAGNVIRDRQLEEIFDIDKIRAQQEGRIFYINKAKWNPFTAHSFITAGQETTTPSYRKWQKIRNAYDDILRLFNIDTYKDFFNKKKEKKESDKNEK
ncbi:hemagglutinin repeat-containing protein [Fusobacterium nucleatum]